MGVVMATTRRCAFQWRGGEPGVPLASLVLPAPLLRLPCYLVSPRPFRYYANTSHVTEWPPEVREYNRSFTKCLETIKKRHDPTVTTVAQGVLEWKRSQNARNINLDVQHWLDRFYMSRIGIRFLIGQRMSLVRSTAEISLNAQLSQTSH